MAVDKTSRAYKTGFWISFNMLSAADTVSDTAVDAVGGLIDIVDNATTGLVDGVTEFNKLNDAKVAAQAVTNAAAAS